MDFDYGVELAESSGGFTRENPVVGPHMAYVRDLIHIGTCPDDRYPDKKATPRCVVVFELMEDHDIDSQGARLTYPYMINMVKGDNSFLNSKFLPSLVTKEELASGAIKGLSDLIGRPVQLQLDPSKATYKDEATGKELPSYINLGGITTAHPKLAALLEPMAEGNLGHVLFKDFKAESLELINMFTHIQKGIMLSDEWKAGTHPAIAMIEEIRKERPNFAKAKAKDETGTAAKGASGSSQPTAQTGSATPESVDGDEEF